MSKKTSKAPALRSTRAVMRVPHLGLLADTGDPMVSVGKQRHKLAHPLLFTVIHERRG
jgi:hypothetical protein